MSTGPTPSLLRIIDVLWSELPAEQVAAIEAYAPEVIDACRMLHELTEHVAELREGAQ